MTQTDKNYVAPTGVSAATELLGGCGVPVRPAPADYDYATDLGLVPEQKLDTTILDSIPKAPAVDYDAAAERLEQAQKNFDEYDRLYVEAQLRKRWAERELNLAYDVFHRAAEAEVSES